MPLSLPELAYANDALEPHIDARTMEIHHDKHHNGYVTKANNALKGTTLESESDPWQVCAKLGELPADKQTAVRNNAGASRTTTFSGLSWAPTRVGTPLATSRAPSTRHSALSMVSKSNSPTPPPRASAPAGRGSMSTTRAT